MVFVGFLMIRQAQEHRLNDRGPVSPRSRPSSSCRWAYSIADGIGAGFLSYVFIRLVQGRGMEVHWLMYVASAVFLIFFANA